MAPLIGGDGRPAERTQGIGPGIRGLLKTRIDRVGADSPEAGAEGTTR